MSSSREKSSSTKKSENAPKKSLEEARRETLSLIDDEGEVIKSSKAKKSSDLSEVLPPISRVDRPKKAVTTEREEPSLPEEVAETPEDSDAPSQGGDGKIIQLKPPIIVRELAEKLGLKPFKLIQELMEMDVFTNVNQSLDPDTAAKVCEKHGFTLEKEKREKGAGVHKVEEVVEEPPPPPIEEKEEDLTPRPPIITFMGHVDHGKTSLLDAIRKTRVVAGEAGGITQHIGAYSVEHGEQSITFLDTPGHAAFTAMRARGAQVTDIVVIVIAADDGIMPQTKEAINHAKAANVAIVVAINKVDLPAADVMKVKTQLQEVGLSPEDWGGDTICCEVSATQGTGMDELLDILALQAEILELKSNHNVPARALIIEAKMQAGKGATATVIVQAGVLKVGTPFICGPYWGKIKNMIDDRGETVQEAPPAMPVEIVGFSELPHVGDELIEMKNDRAARGLSEERLAEQRQEKLARPARPTLENLFSTMEEGEKKSLRLVIKGDVQGSIEALLGALDQIKSDKIQLEILHSAAGPVSESDILLASASNAIVIGFGVKVEGKAVSLAKREGVQIKLFSIIYELIDQVKEAMLGLLDPEMREKPLGHAEVKQVFKLSSGIVAGCVVIDGRITRTGRARVLRGKQPVYDGDVATLKRFQDDVSEVKNGLECGIKLGNFVEYEPGDVIECYELEKIEQKL